MQCKDNLVTDTVRRCVVNTVGYILEDIMRECTAGAWGSQVKQVAGTPWKPQGKWEMKRREVNG